MSKSTPLNQVPVSPEDNAINQEIDNVIGEFANPNQFVQQPQQMYANPNQFVSQQPQPQQQVASKSFASQISEEDTKLLIVCATIFVVFSIPRVTQLLFSHIPVQNDMAKLLIKAVLFGAAVVVVMKFV